VLTFFLTELIIPHTNSKSNKIWSVDVKKQDQTRLYGSNQIWYKSSNAIYWIKHFDGDKKVMVNPTFYFFDGSHNLIKRMDAKRVIWKDDQWQARKGIVQTLGADGEYELKNFKGLTLEIPETPDVFLTGVKEPEDMSYWELKRLSEKIRQEGYDNIRYLVELDIKIAYPFVILILVVIGIPLALTIKKGGAPLAVSIGIFICFIYLFIFGLFRSLGVAGMLPHLLSAWAANLIFLCLGIYLMMRVER
jgi:lipopolysaccharide export system permease protein